MNITSNSLTKMLTQKCLFRPAKRVLSVIRTFVTQTEKEVQQYPEECLFKVLKVAIVGMPNAGKSTLVNNLMSRKVCATSPKVHTTRDNAEAILNDGNTQVIFLDTPGLVKLQEYRKFSLEHSCWSDPMKSFKEADLIGVIHDVSNKYTRECLDIKVIKMLERYVDKPSMLVLNKIDMLKSKRKLLDVTRIVTEGCIKGKPFGTSKLQKLRKENDDIRGWPNFSEVFMVSALTGGGVEDIKKYLIQQAKPGNWKYPSEVWTNQTPEEIIVKTVKAVLLQYLPQEIPYLLKPCMEFMEIQENGIVTAVVLVESPSERITKFVCGASDGRLKQITEEVQYNLQNAFQNFVRLKIVIQSKSNK